MTVHILDKYRQVSFPLFIQGKTFLDDLAFSYYFHSQPSNQLIHMVGIIPQIFLVMWLLYTLFGSPVMAVVAAAYVGAHIYMTPIVGAIFAVVLTILFVILNTTTLSFVQLLLVIIVAAVAPLGGHRVFEGKFPAFRVMEATFTTPHLMVILALSHFHFFDRVTVDAIRHKSADFKDSENWARPMSSGKPPTTD